MTDSPVTGKGRRKPLTPWEHKLLLAVVGIVVILIAIVAVVFFWPSISGGWNKFWNDPAKREQVQHVPIGDLSIELTKTPSPRMQSPPPAQAVASATTEVAMAPEALPQTPAAARSRAMSPYKGFWYEANLTPERLAKLVEDALLRDPTGQQLIDEAKCARDGSCASPMNYLEAARVYDPQARLEHVSELPKYFRSLVLDCTIKGRFMVADIFKPQAGPMRGRTDTSRMSRFIGLAECVFKNPRTGQPIIAQFCANPAGKRVAPPPPAEPPCVTLTFNHKYFEGGKVHWGVGSTTGRLKDHACNAQRQGSGKWEAWGSRCDACIPPVRYLRRLLGSTAEWVQNYAYRTRHSKQTLRFSEEVWTKAVYLCLKASDGSQTCGVYMRPQDWQGRHHVVVPDSLWMADNGDCPN